MNMEVSHAPQPHQVHIGLAKEELDCERRLAQAICNDVQSIRGTVGILLALCKGNRKIDPADLNGLLTILDETLDGTEDWAHGVRIFLERLTPASAFVRCADGNDNAGLRIVPSTASKS